MKDKISILHIAFDYRGLLRDNPEEIIEKLNRDRMGAQRNNFLLISWANINFVRKISDNIMGVNLLSRFKHFRPWNDLLSIFYAPYICRKNKFKPDVLIVYDFSLIFPGLYFKYFFGTKIFVVLTNLPTDLIAKRSGKGGRLFYQYVSEFLGKYFVEKFLTINKATKNYVLNLGISEKKISSFNPDVISRDFEFISQVENGAVRKKFNIANNKKIIFSVGRLEPEKGFERMINSFIEINYRDWVLLIAGRGKLENKLRQIIEKNNFENNIILVGYVERSEIWNYYQDADLFMLLPHSEALGLVFWEAMFMRVPVIGSTADGVVETIGNDGERGLIFQGDDYLKLEEKIKKVLILNDDEVKQMVERAYCYVSQKINEKKEINDFL